ncbi:MAG TPA: peptidoglycan DD-metalloendopeptidase family protein [Solirubrobacterales bacterium]|nr:peptidoglycan DD-metalloendopeptidase family protein [Solirubrobacterales bacterium]
MSFTFAAIALLLCLAASAAATTGGAPTVAGAPPPSGSPTGAPAGAAPSAGVLSLISAQTAPRKSFFYGFRYPNVRFSIASTQPQNDLQIDVVNSAGEVARSFYRNDVEPSAEVRIRWDGTTSEGRPARNGRYSFRIGPQGGTEVTARATTSSEPLSLGFALYGYAFPILGAHEFGGSAGRFGAGRSGHTHQGQDVMAACGTPLLAARGGTVQYSGYQYAAGNYVVIDGRGTTLDFMYAHLAEPSPLQTGDQVRTGQPIGVVGDTGDASGCHLHFEIWTAPGWYEGGSPVDPLSYLEKWDRYS